MQASEAKALTVNWGPETELAWGLNFLQCFKTTIVFSHHFRSPYKVKTKNWKGLNSLGSCLYVMSWHCSMCYSLVSHLCTPTDVPPPPQSVCLSPLWAITSLGKKTFRTNTRGASRLSQMFSQGNFSLTSNLFMSFPTKTGICWREVIWGGHTQYCCSLRAEGRWTEGQVGRQFMCVCVEIWRLFSCKFLHRLAYHF